jgi:hypothetical protein
MAEPATDPNVISTDLPPVSPEAPLEGLETDVLRVWMENSSNVRKMYQLDPQRVEQAVRDAVQRALVQELDLRAQGLRPHEVEEHTRPAMWTPPTFQLPT